MPASQTGKEPAARDSILPAPARSGPTLAPAGSGRIPARAMVAALLVAGLLLAGCLATTTPRTIHGDGTPWTEADSAPWVVQQTGCGHCAGDPAVPEHQVTAVYAGDEVLRFTYGVGPHDETGVRFNDSLGPIQPAVEGLLAHLGLGEDDDTLLWVHDTTALRLPSGEPERVHRVLESNLRHAIDPGEPDLSDTVDLAPTRIVVLPRMDHEAPGHAWDVRLDPHDHENDAWGGVLAQMAQVDRWLQEAT